MKISLILFLKILFALIEESHSSKWQCPNLMNMFSTLYTRSLANQPEDSYSSMSPAHLKKHA